MAQGTHSSSKIDNLADKAAGTVNDLACQAQDVAGRVADQGREATEGVQEVAGNIKGAIDKSVGAYAFLVMSGLCLAALPVAFSLIEPTVRSAGDSG